MSQIKRQLSHNISQTGESYDHQHALQTIGMRIRKAVSEGYQVGDEMHSTQRYSLQQQQQQQEPQQQHMVPPRLLRVPLPSSVVVPPMLGNASSSFGSSMAEWENNLDLRLKDIDQVLAVHQQGLNKRRFDSVDNDW